LELTKTQKLNNNVLKQNDNILIRLSKEKMKRHVKEKNEPVLEGIMKDVSDDYSKIVVMNSSNEILKLLNE
jgi:hypothetical protein